MYRKTTRETLEYNQILEIIKQYWPEKILFKAPEFSKKRSDIENKFLITKDIMNLLEIDSDIINNDIEDISNIIADRGESVVLAPYEIKAIYNMNKYFSDLYNIGIRIKDEYSNLANLLLNIEKFSIITKEIEKVFDNQFEIKNSASPLIKYLRKQLKQKEEILNKRISSYVRKHKNELQDEIITIRDGRYVIPVNREFRAKVEGVVHGISNTGNTLFVEPSFAIEINNDIRTLILEEKQEIYKILLKMTHFILKFKDALILDMITVKDFIKYLSFARYAKDYKCNIPEFSENNDIILNNGRNPILLYTGKNVIPISLNIPGNKKIIVISGPNAGGKTATIKLIGIFSLMFQSGIPIPAENGTKLPIFDNIFADIGDEQSVVESVSTFTSHMLHLKEIIYQTTSSSLVLLDEIGSSTAPKEGSALAIAILKTLEKMGAKIFVTTHYDELKQFAIENNNALNIAMGFDIEKSVPTYRLFEGVPGSSYAFSIARMVGFRDDIIDIAEEEMGVQKGGFETDFIVLEEKLKGIEIKEKLLDKKINFYESLSKKYEIKLEKVKEEAKSIIEYAKSESNKLVNNSRKKIEKLVKEIKESNASKESIINAREILKKPSVEKEIKTDNLLNIKIGDYVNIENIDGTGIIKNFNRKKASVEFNGIIYNVPRTRIYEILQNREQKIENVTIKISRDRELSYDLDLRGKRVIEGIDAVDKYIDDAIISGVSKFRIIHGMGTGALKNAISKFLKEDRRVISFYPDEGPGSAGCTTVEI
ncbi:hypothetical protein DRP43_03345 [candidate division TA06 bacterium]|uniref:Endonuclease MutS2 n=1 Tax=candidate division TA06 bacterium TaxID=2250710 RepID=A0A660SI22_UNCT6|nr:MAG: hypothetical protein DRP43_03345 [candidate division TA06 bacterium]